MTRLTYVYDDDSDRPDRPVAALQASEWTEIDLELLQGLDLYENTLCPGCQIPQRLAWHKHTEEEWDPHSFVCHACSAKQGHEVVYSSPPRLVKDPASLPPFTFPEMTTEPTKKTTGG